MARREKYVPEARRGIKTLACRVHLHDYVALKKILHDDGLTVQSFLAGCIDSYIRRDRPMRDVVADQIRLAQLPSDVKDEYMLSPRERMALFEEIDGQDTGIGRRRRRG